MRVAYLFPFAHHCYVMVFHSDVEQMLVKVDGEFLSNIIIVKSDLTTASETKKNRCLERQSNKHLSTPPFYPRVYRNWW